MLSSARLITQARKLVVHFSVVVKSLRAYLGFFYSVLTISMPITDVKKCTAYYRAFVDRQSDYIGIFYAAVKTTSIFCLPTCRARKPRAENVEFFRQAKEALNAGYRPCKICQPMQNANQAPPQVQAALDLLRDHPKQKISDADLRQQQINPQTLRRWFKQHYRMSFHAYQRMCRINTAYQELQTGRKATDAAFDNGYDSLSGFGYTYKKIVGKSPRQSRQQTLIRISRLTTPLGPMFVCATDDGICMLDFVDRRMLETEFRDLQRRLDATLIAGENEHIEQCKSEIDAYFSGRLQQFGVALCTPGSAFQQTVWQALRDIPYAQTCSYQTLAETIGKPAAVRAVGAANGQNRVAIIIPCHRVIGQNGDLTGYGGGLERKRWLLDHEKRGSEGTMAKTYQADEKR